MVALLALLQVSWKLSDVHPAPGCKGEILIGKSIYIAAGDRSEPQANLACFRSDDAGKNWQKLGSILVDPVPNADLGDGNLLRLPDGRLWVVYRRNHNRGVYASSPEYGVHVSESADGGRTWHLQSMVAQHRLDFVGVSRGYWAPFLFRTRSGKIQCYYDDEYTPYQNGFKGHQWVEMKTYYPDAKTWSPENTVSRAPNVNELSRDGMATVIETKPRRLVCLLESVSTTKPIVGVVREVTSDDDGKSWSWTKGERPVVYQAAAPYHSFSPWLAQLSGGAICCLFATDEANGAPEAAGTPAHRLRMDIKMLVSEDAGKSWSKSPILVYAGGHHSYLPSAVPLSRNALLASWIDFDHGPMIGVLSR